MKKLSKKKWSGFEPQYDMCSIPGPRNKSGGIARKKVIKLSNVDLLDVFVMEVDCLIQAAERNLPRQTPDMKQLDSDAAFLESVILKRMS